MMRGLLYFPINMNMIFKRETRKGLGLDYYINMNMDDDNPLSYMAGKFGPVCEANTGRKILPLSDNSSAHVTSESIPHLQAVEVFFPLPNGTSHIQPLE